MILPRLQAIDAASLRGRHPEREDLPSPSPVDTAREEYAPSQVYIKWDRLEGECDSEEARSS